MENKDQLSVFLDELCYLCSKRNSINHARSKARWKRAYWKNALKLVRAWTYTDPKYLKFKKRASHFPKDLALRAMVDDLELEMESIKRERSKPKRWIEMGAMKIRMNMLESEAQYVKAKYETMVFTLNNKERMEELRDALGYTVNYRDGYVSSLRRGYEIMYANSKEFKLRAERHELNIAISNMIET